MLMRVSARWRLAACCLALEALGPGPVVAQQAAPAAPQPAATPAADEAAEFSTEQLDALLAPIALYPDALLAQILMASTYPLQIVDAARWVADPAHKSLTGDALTTALNPLSWDPSVKSLVPFPQVLETMNSKLDWMQQVGYAFATQQTQVWDSVQRLRRQAQAAGTLQSTPQQVVRNEAATVTYEPAPAGAAGASVPQQAMPAQADNIVIEPAQADTVYVPSYDPSTAFGTWPYPEYPPVALPPPAPAYGYGLGTALATGLLFGAGVAVTASLWNWARPSWGGGYTNVNVNRFNQINYNRRPINNGVWRPSAASGGWHRPPTGPVGRPVRGNGLPASAIGRQHVSVPSSLVNRPVNSGNFNNNNVAINRPGGGGQGIANRPGGGEGIANRPGGGQGTNRPGGGQGIANRPGGGQGVANRPGGGQGVANRPGGGQGIANRPGGGQGVANRPGGGQGFANRPGGGQGAANRPGGGQGIANRPGGGQGVANRPGGGQGVANRPGGGQGIANRPGGGQAIANRPGGGAAQRPAIQRPAAPTRQPAAFAGARDGQRASQFAQRGGQSRQFNQAQRPAGGFQRGGGGGGGGFRGGGGGGRGGGGGGGHRGRH